METPRRVRAEIWLFHELKVIITKLVTIIITIVEVIVTVIIIIAVAIIVIIMLVEMYCRANFRRRRRRERLLGSCYSAAAAKATARLRLLGQVLPAPYFSMPAPTPTAARGLGV